MDWVRLKIQPSEKVEFRSYKEQPDQYLRFKKIRFLILIRPDQKLADSSVLNTGYESGRIRVCNSAFIESILWQLIFNPIYILLIFN